MSRQKPGASLQASFEGGLATTLVCESLGVRRLLGPVIQHRGSRLTFLIGTAPTYVDIDWGAMLLRLQTSVATIGPATSSPDIGRGPCNRAGASARK